MPQELVTKKMQAVIEELNETEPKTQLRISELITKLRREIF